MWGDGKELLKLEWSERHNYSRLIPVSDQEPGAQRASDLPATPSPTVRSCRAGLDSKAQAVKPCPPTPPHPTPPPPPCWGMVLLLLENPDVRCRGSQSGQYSAAVGCTLQGTRGRNPASFLCVPVLRSNLIRNSWPRETLGRTHSSDDKAHPCPQQD